jgi:hypothetical protein
VTWWTIVLGLFGDAGTPDPPPPPAAETRPAPDEDAKVIEQLEFLQAMELLKDKDVDLFLDDDEDAAAPDGGTHE